MMSQSRSCIMFLLLSAVAGYLSVTGAEITVKYVCLGDSVQAFQNIEFNHCNADVHLVINDDRNAEIAIWSIRNCIRNESLLPKYKGKLSFDQNGTITIKNFDHFDQANYVVISKMDPLPKIYEVQLSLMVAPTNACKPIIEQLGDNLIASLKANDCGKPEAVPYWKDYDSVLNTNERIVKLIPEAEAREYIACIKGAALACVKNVTSLDYCTRFKTEGKKCPPVSSEKSNANEHSVVYIISSNTFILVLATVVVYVIFVRYRRRENLILQNVNQRWENEKQGDLILQNVNQRWENEKQGENVNEKQTSMVLETPKLWRKHFGMMNWEDIITLLNDDQRMGFQAYCDNLIVQNDNQRRENERQGDSENDEEETQIEQQSCKDQDSIEELMPLREVVFCTICLVKEMNIFFLPCRHLAACSRCSFSLQQCPLCRAVIKNKLPIRLD